VGRSGDVAGWFPPVGCLGHPNPSLLDTIDIRSMTSSSAAAHLEPSSRRYVHSLTLL
jgi:hypothetical protein